MSQSGNHLNGVVLETRSISLDSFMKLRKQDEEVAAMLLQQQNQQQLPQTSQ
jgi:hypothetical protein